MAEILPDGTMQGYYNICPNCKKTIEVNMQGTPLNHKCKAKMRGIIGCEESQEVTKAFRKRGHSFFSLDIKDCSGGHPEWHIKSDFFHYIPTNVISLDFLGVHPVCKYMANSGVRWLTSKKPKPGFEWSEKYGIYMNMERYELMSKAALFFRSALSCVKSVGKGYVEQPVLHKYALELIGEKPTQVIQPWMFGHTTKKATMLWLVGLPKLTPTDIVPKELRTDEIHKCPPSKDRETIRSKTFLGIAKAMAEQWSVYIEK